MARQETRTADRLRLRLVVDVTYLPQGVPEGRLREMLGGIIARSLDEGLVTQDTEAEAEACSFHVEKPEGEPRCSS
jgi:hypothetical protein